MIIKFNKNFILSILKISGTKQFIINKDIINSNVKNEIIKKNKYAIWYA